MREVEKQIREEIEQTWETIQKLDREGRHVEADLMRFLKDKLNEELDSLYA